MKDLERLRRFLLVSFGLLGFLVAAKVAEPAYDDIQSLPFDGRLWRDVEYAYDASKAGWVASPRLLMVADLMNNQRLIGRSEDWIESTLGKACKPQLLDSSGTIAYVYATGSVPESNGLGRWTDNGPNDTKLFVFMRAGICVGARFEGGLRIALVGEQLDH